MDYGSASDVEKLVHTVVEDALRAVQLQGSTSVTSQTTLLSGRPDGVVAKLSTGKPFVVIESKLPGIADENHEQYLPQLYNYMMSVQCSYLVTPVFGIFVGYDSWYFCVLGDRVPDFDYEPKSPKPSTDRCLLPQTPQQTSQSSTSQQDPSLERPSLRLFSNKNKEEEEEEETEEKADDTNEWDRHLFVSPVCHWNDKNFWGKLAGFLFAAYNEDQESPAVEGNRCVGYVKVNEPGMGWVKRDYGADSLRPTPPLLNNLWYLLWETLGAGAYGRVLLASSFHSKKACAIKFFFSTDDRNGAEKEVGWWNKVYPHIQVKSVTVLGRNALVMPVFNPIPLAERLSYLPRIKDECSRFAKMNICHGDVRWRNIGLTAEEDVVLFDFSKTFVSSNDWVDDVVVTLKRSMGGNPLAVHSSQPNNEKSIRQSTRQTTNPYQSQNRTTDP